MFLVQVEQVVILLPDRSVESVLFVKIRSNSLKLLIDPNKRV